MLSDEDIERMLAENAEWVKKLSPNHFARYGAIFDCARRARRDGGSSPGGLKTIWYMRKHLVEKWIAQGGFCFLTGERLAINGEPGERWELDHIIPIARGGKDEPGNFQFVTKCANREKGSLTDNELRSLCRKIVSHENALDMELIADREIRRRM